MLAGTDAEVGEAWVQQHAKMLHDGFASKGIGAGDYFILPRHAWAGSWRYSAALWSGDIESTFDELAIQIKVLQGVMMSGPALWTTDIGGYWNGDATQPEFQELVRSRAPGIGEWACATRALSVMRAHCPLSLPSVSLSLSLLDCSVGPVRRLLPPLSPPWPPRRWSPGK